MPQNNHSEIKALSVLYIALLAGQILFTLIALFIVNSINFSSGSSLITYSNYFIMLCIVIGVIAYLGSSTFFRKKMEQINSRSVSLSQKLNEYRAASIARWAFMEFAVLFCIILFLVSHIYALLIIAAADILLFLTTRPTLEKVASDLQISESEIEQMNSGNSL